MSGVRLGAVEYLNARPLVYGLDRDPAFHLRYDVPARCAALLHEGGIDVGLIPSIEYLRGGRCEYCIVPDLAIASRGPVASVALYTTRAIRDVTSVALDTSSRTSVALVRVLCARVFGIEPSFVPLAPDLRAMLARADAALLIGDRALLTPSGALGGSAFVEKIDLGSAWTDATGLPFVYAFWAGRTGALEPAHVAALQRARDAGVAASEAIARAYFAQAEEQMIGARYLRDNICYALGDDEREGLERFFRYAHELDLAPLKPLRFYKPMQGGPSGPPGSR